ncbi:MAG: hypothetical protein ACK41P_05250 [Asticcacaulis sp.]
MSKGVLGAIRSATAFFLVTFSTAFLFSIGVRLTGWFTQTPKIAPNEMQGMGISIMLGVAVLVIGAGMRRLSAAEMQAALLGASAILLSMPLSLAVMTNSWGVSTAVMAGLGLLMLALGLVIASTANQPKDGE